ncbi:hypothetical protein PC41400_14515 [Paenibacillus chitinolyticus]|uniref:Uncharacterized protein n=1 Tax=Paenibacillus chitinolyticus TaxID=79263 RepID=A0A410WWF5_9BACL|nr:hypothetical protein [Paenibacillus chitinolyticus]MCY9593999.1 hypothetical protein [Paenibacillus chitinolyticus]MCY9598544.1 hypothetical protein [Paenibacillus chitinolyticus]QAV18826.1 hypothetical protein PC41400_14515 [Paenibacillus chitinolyticus]
MPKLKNNAPTIEESKDKTCTSCGKTKKMRIDFYMSNSKHHSDRRYPVCKVCIKKDLNINEQSSIRSVLLEMNRPFLFNVWSNALIEAEKKNSDPFGLYLKSIQLSYKELTWPDSDVEYVGPLIENKINPTATSDQINILINTNDKRNEEDVVTMLGYDPFVVETAADRIFLFGRLVDFLDESTLEDGFKLPAVVEIVKTFHQIDKINAQLSSIMTDSKSVASNIGGITSLVNAKEKMLKSVLALAKDNGISVNHNNNKSKGSGTLSGIIKTLHENGFDEAQVNLFDIETSEGMLQVADISNRSILNQLQFDENDYVSMLTEQRELIQELDKKVLALEEENRLLKRNEKKQGLGNDK